MLAVLLALDRAIFKSGHNPTKLTNEFLELYGLDRKTKRRVLRQLEAAGVITVWRNGKEAPLVRLNWRPPQ